MWRFWLRPMVRNHSVQLNRCFPSAISRYHNVSNAVFHWHAASCGNPTPSGHACFLPNWTQHTRSLARISAARRVAKPIREAASPLETSGGGKRDSDADFVEHQPLDDAHEHELRAKETNEQLGDDNDIEADLTHKAYARSAEKKRKDKAPTPTARKPRGIALPSYISPPDLASKLNCTLRELMIKCQRMTEQLPWWPQLNLKRARKRGYADIKDFIFSHSEASAVATAMNYSVTFDDVDPQHRPPRPVELRLPAPVNLQPRNPVVCIMGHVDHGKTTLLDALRQSNVASREAGGITQDIYSFQVNIPDPLRHCDRTLRSALLAKSFSLSPSSDRRDASAVSSSSSASHSVITFLDTPGHEEFVAMRANGSYLADVALVVVAADRGCEKQTMESLRFALDNRSFVILVINKMDMPAATLGAKSIRRELTSRGMGVVNLDDVCSKFDHAIAEAKAGLSGGLSVARSRAKTSAELVRATEPLLTGMAVVEVSAKTGTNLDKLRNRLVQLCGLIPAAKRLADLNAVPSGVVVDGFNARGRGDVVRVILREGTLRLGQWFACGVFHGKVRSLRSLLPSGESVSLSAAVPGVPVEVAGPRDGLPNPGEFFFVWSKEKCEAIAQLRQLDTKYLLQPRFAEEEAGETVASAEVEEERVEYVARYEDVDATGNTDPVPAAVSSSSATQLSTLDRARIAGRQEALARRQMEEEYAQREQGVFEDEEEEEKAGERVEEQEDSRFTPSDGTELNDDAEAGDENAVNLVLKANSVGSLRILTGFTNTLVKTLGRPVNIIRGGVGEVTKEDVAVAAVDPNIRIYCFRVGALTPHVVAEVKKARVHVHRFAVFYDMLDHIYETYAAPPPSGTREGDGNDTSTSKRDADQPRTQDRRRSRGLVEGHLSPKPDFAGKKSLRRRQIGASASSATASGAQSQP